MDDIKYNADIGAFVKITDDDGIIAPEKVDQFELKKWMAENPLPTTAVAASPLASKTVRQGLSKAARGFLSALGSPVAALGFAGTTIKENIEEGKGAVESIIDPMVGAELLYPEVAKKVGAKGLTGVLGRALTLGRIGTMMTPVGLGITALGLGKMGYDAYQKEQERRKALTPEEREAEDLKYQEEVDIQNFGAA
jgi:hypothetical protein